MSSSKFSLSFFILFPLFLFFTNSLELNTTLLDEIYSKEPGQLFLPHLSLAITDKNKTIYSYFRFSEKDKKNPDRPHYICSMTKSFTTIGIMQLVDKGLITLNQTLADIDKKYFEKFFINKDDLNYFTIGELLNHTSGLMGDERKYELKVDRKRGKTYDYSNNGFSLLGEVIKIKSGLSYEDYLQQFILKPLNMTKSTTDMTLSLKNNFIESYINVFGFYFTSDNSEEWLMEDDGFRIACGGLMSTVEDICKYLRFYMNGNDSILPYKYIEFITNETVEIDKGNYYGAGWRIFYVDGHKVVAHSGGLDTFNTYMFYILDLEIGGTVLINAFDSLSDSSITKLVKTFIINACVGKKDYQRLPRTYLAIHISLDVSYLILLAFTVISVYTIINQLIKKEKVNKFLWFSVNIKYIRIPINFCIYIAGPVIAYALPKSKGLYHFFSEIFSWEYIVVLICIGFLFVTGLLKVYILIKYWNNKEVDNNGEVIDKEEEDAGKISTCDYETKLADN